jgi:hypothetical protein
MPRVPPPRPALVDARLTARQRPNAYHPAPLVWPSTCVFSQKQRLAVGSVGLGAAGAGAANKTKGCPHRCVVGITANPTVPAGKSGEIRGKPGEKQASSHRAMSWRGPPPGTTMVGEP